MNKRESKIGNELFIVFFKITLPVNSPVCYEF